MSKVIGWEGIGPEDGKFVSVEDGYSYAAHECGILAIDLEAPLAEEFQEMLVVWFFSGNWIEEKVVEDG